MVGQPDDPLRRLFVAVRPTPTLTGQLAELSNTLAGAAGEAVRWSRPEDYHVTLRYLGLAAVGPVVEALDRVLPVEPITIELGPGLIELGTAIAAPVTGADGLAAVVAEAMTGLDVAEPQWPFLGHLMTSAELMDSVAPTARDERPAPSAARYRTIATWPARRR